MTRVPFFDAHVRSMEALPRHFLCAGSVPHVVVRSIGVPEAEPKKHFSFPRHFS